MIYDTVSLKLVNQLIIFYCAFSFYITQFKKH